MPFRYRLQKVLDFRIRKKEEQLLVVQKAQEAVFIAEDNIRKNEQEIQNTKNGMRQADPMMYEAYDKYLNHLWEKAEELEQIRVEAQKQLDIEKHRFELELKNKNINLEIKNIILLFYLIYK